MLSASSSSSRSAASTEAAEMPRPGPSLSPAAVCGWLGLAILLFLLQTLPYLSYRWVTDESWYAGPAYSIAHGNGVADPAIGPNDLENHFDARPPGTAMVIAAQALDHPLPGAPQTPRPKLLIDRLPGREINRHLSPLAARFYHIQHGLGDTPQRVFAWPASGMAIRRRLSQQCLQLRPLRIR
jgi:hypothetical protein